MIYELFILNKYSEMCFLKFTTKITQPKIVTTKNSVKSQ